MLVDEDTQDAHLVKLLRDAGHGVASVNEAGLRGKHDVDVLAHARETDRVTLTYNCKDFRALHNQSNDHPGILAVYDYTMWHKNLTLTEVVRCIANLEASEWPIEGEFIPLNAWKF